MATELVDSLAFMLSSLAATDRLPHWPSLLPYHGRDCKLEFTGSLCLPPPRPSSSPPSILFGEHQLPPTVATTFIVSRHRRYSLARQSTVFLVGRIGEIGNWGKDEREGDMGGGLHLFFDM